VSEHVQYFRRSDTRSPGWRYWMLSKVGIFHSGYAKVFIPRLGSALEALPIMMGLLDSRPDGFDSLEEAVQWQ